MLGRRMPRPILAFVLGWSLSREVQAARQSEQEALMASEDAAQLAKFEEQGCPGCAGAIVGGLARQERERKEREAEKKREAEKHRVENRQDCKVSEQWGEWGECSATCGGGISTRHLVAREIVTPQDKFGYGTPCPSACSPSTSACTSRAFRQCGVELCGTDCSTVDLKNRLAAPGGAAAWEFERASGGPCVFQLWQVLSGADGPRIRLLGQTKPQGKGANATVYDSSSGETTPYFLQAQGVGTPFQDVAIGFRGCALKAQAEGAPAVARVCHWGGEAFTAAAQTATLDDQQKEQLAQFRDASRQTLGTELARAAATASGVGAEDAAVVFEGAGAGPGFAVRATMAAQPPDAPALGPASTDADGVRIPVTAPPPNDNGAALLPGFRVSVRRVFGQGAMSWCAPVPLPACQGGSEPCVAEAEGAELLLRNFPLASKFEVQVAAQNAAGVGQPAKTFAFTRVKPSLPLEECMVDYWACTSSNGDSKGTIPSAGDARCQLTALPLPLCQMKPKEPECDGSKHFRQCTAKLIQGKEGCVAPLETVCVYDAPQVDGKKNQKCENVGCPTAIMFWNQRTCCCLSEADTEEDDSPNCACTKGKCADWGLVQAKYSNSCRH